MILDGFGSVGHGFGGSEARLLAGVGVEEAEGAKGSGGAGRQQAVEPWGRLRIVVFHHFSIILHVFSWCVHGFPPNFTRSSTSPGLAQVQYDVAVQKERLSGQEGKALEREAAQLEAQRRLQELHRELQGQGELLRAAFEEHKRQVSAVRAFERPLKGL